jgi:hypothetical protein
MAFLGTSLGLGEVLFVLKYRLAGPSETVREHKVSPGPKARCTLDVERGRLQ